jgi:Ca-activated chloride channel homolog
VAWSSHFAHPQLLLVAVVPALMLVGYVVEQRRRARRIRRFTGLSAVPPRRNPWRHLPITLAVLSLLALTVAVAGPVRNIEVPRNRAVVVLAIDVSPSMKSTDVSPNRLVAAEDAATTFAKGLTPGVNLGLVAFSGNAELLVSPTPDHTATVDALQHLQTDDGTATGQGIFTALEAIRTVSDVLGGQSSTPLPARIVLLSDGAENRPPNPDNPTGAYTAARAAAAQRIPISTITLGTPGGAVEMADHRVPVPVDDSTMTRIAQLSGGHTYAASDVDALADSYADIKSDMGHVTERGPGSPVWVQLGLGLFTAAVVAALLINRRVPV